MIRALIAALCLALPAAAQQAPAPSERVVAGLSQSAVSLPAPFQGSDSLG